MRVKLGLMAIAMLLLNGCKTIAESSEISALSGAQLASVEKYNIGFEAAPSYIAKNQVALTFDDGVDAVNTPKVLDTLRDLKVKATFFVNNNGASDLSSPAIQTILKRIVAEGHDLANHTASHSHLPTLSADAIRSEVLRVANPVKSITGKNLTLIRAPFGEPYQVEAQSPGSQPSYMTVMSTVAEYGIHVGWNFDSDDWRYSSGAEVLNNVKGLVNQGRYGVVLFHSTNAHTAASIGDIIKFMKCEKKLSFISVEDVVKGKNKKFSAELLGVSAGTDTFKHSFDGFEAKSCSAAAVTPPPITNNSSCKAEAWQQGKFYPVGSQVVFQNQLFTAANANPGYDPKVSTWFWSAGAVCSSVVAPTQPTQPTKPVEPAKPIETGSTIPKTPEKNTCKAPFWEQGKNYKVGDVVIFQGQLFTTVNENPGYDPKISTWFWKAGDTCR